MTRLVRTKLVLGYHDERKDYFYLIVFWGPLTDSGIDYNWIDGGSGGSETRREKGFGVKKRTR
jgi:hypothetical protein